MDVSVVIVNYNTKALLKQCLESIYVKTQNIDFEIIVIDNASTDDSIQMLKAEFPSVRLIENTENLGFGRASNLGAMSANGNYLIFLNSDTILLNNAFHIFFNSMILNNISLCGCYLYNSDKEKIHSFDSNASPLRTLVRFSYYSFPILRKIKLFFIKDNSLNEKQHLIKVGYITGADIFVKKEIFKKIGGFDEHFFMYFEDDDFCRRAKLAGFDSFIISGPKIIHLEGASIKHTYKKIKILEKSFLYYMKKYNTKKTYAIIKFSLLVCAYLRLFSLNYTLNEKIDLLKSLHE